MKRIIGAALLVLAVPAQAESVTMQGTFPAGNQQISEFRSIGVLPFSGTDGPKLSFSIERALSEPDGPNPPHFTVYAATRGGQAAPDGIISGVVTTGVTETNYTYDENKCTSKSNGKCVATTIVVHQCIRRVIELQSDIRVVDNATSGIVYSDVIPKREEISWCDSAQPATTVEAAVRTLIEETARDFRLFAAPHNETYKIRFLESTKGMDKASKQAFKAVVKLTQVDLKAACEQFADLSRVDPDRPHPSVIFNLGLCAEASGDYYLAELNYRLAGELGAGNEAAEGRQRATLLEAARAAAAAR